MASTNHEKTIRESAKALGEAISNAQAAGYAISWPGRPDGLATIEISETAAVGAESQTATALTPVAVAGKREFGDDASKDAKTAS